MSPGKGKIFLVFLTATLQIIILQAAPADDAPNTAAQPAAAPAAAPAADAPSVNPSTASASPSQGTAGVQASTDDLTANKPSKPMVSKPTGAKPINLVSGALKPSSGDQTFGSCWSCLLQTVEQLCSYLTDWTSPKKIPALNLFSVFHESSPEESAEDATGMSGIASLFRFKRSVEDPGMAQEAFLELLDGYYVKARERFASENPGLVLAGLNNLYNRPDEIAQVVAYVLGVPKERLVQVFRNMKTRRTGEILLKALADRRGAQSGEVKLENKSVNGLTPTSISYFFKELLGSVNGVATGLSEIISIVLQNQNTNVQPNQVKLTLRDVN